MDEAYFKKRSMEMKLPALLGNYDRQADQPTDQPPTDTRRHREVSHPKSDERFNCLNHLVNNSILSIHEVQFHSLLGPC